MSPQCYINTILLWEEISGCLHNTDLTLMENSLPHTVTFLITMALVITSFTTHCHPPHPQSNYPTTCTYDFMTMYWRSDQTYTRSAVYTIVSWNGWCHLSIIMEGQVVLVKQVTCDYAQDQCKGHVYVPQNQYVHCIRLHFLNFAARITCEQNHRVW